MKSIRLSVIALLAAAMTMGATAKADNTLTYSYDTGAGEKTAWGTQKKENYDVAVRIADASLVGKKVSGVKVPLVGTAGMTGFKVWLSKELKLETVDGTKRNAPDIVSVDVTPAGNELNVTLAEPYTLTAEGVYVGYSFDVTELTDDAKAPIVLSVEPNADGLYMHTSRTYRSWGSYASAFGAVSSIGVVLSGDFREHSAGISSVMDVNARKGDASAAQVVIVNHGLSAVSSVDYEYEVAGQKGTGRIDMTEPMAAQYNKVATVRVPLPAIAATGDYTLGVKLTKVNGVDNDDLMASAAGTLSVYSLIPVHRPLLEEYTGLWCGYCPRGFVGLELMNERYPDAFVGVSYHNDDEMEVMPSYMFPSNIDGFPAAWIDRVHATDAYYGDGTTYAFGIDKTYMERAAQFVPVAVEVEAAWSDATKATINVKSTIVSVRKLEDVDYRVGYILVADDLHGEGPSWAQSNYFVGDKKHADCDGMAQFVNGSSKVEGLHFNDVVVLAPDLTGVVGSLPATLEADATHTHDYQFTLADAVNTAGKFVVQDREKVRVVVVIVDAKTGAIVNSNKTPVGSSSAVGISPAVQSDGAVEKVEYYDTAGRKVARPANGLYMKSVTYRNGSVKTSKVIVK